MRVKLTYRLAPDSAHHGNTVDLDLLCNLALTLSLLRTIRVPQYVSHGWNYLRFAPPYPVLMWKSVRGADDGANAGNGENAMLSEENDAGGDGNKSETT